MDAAASCLFKSEYAGATGKHQKVVTFPESAATPVLDEWIMSHFDPKNIDAAIEAMVAGQAEDDAAAARTEAARRKLADCDKRLERYPMPLESGDVPDVVLGWIRDVEAQKHTAEQELAARTRSEPYSEAEVRALVKLVRRRLRGLGTATPEQRQVLYGELGLSMTYNPEDDSLDVEVRPSVCTQVRVGGGTCTETDWRVRPWSE